MLRARTALWQEGATVVPARMGLLFTRPCKESWDPLDSLLLSIDLSIISDAQHSNTSFLWYLIASKPTQRRSRSPETRIKLNSTTHDLREYPRGTGNRTV